jgi:hypothetical protein
MSETKRPVRKPYNFKRRQRGTAAVEFALVAVTFFTLLFGVIELARLMFLFNTLPVVTSRAARAAANTDFANADRIDEVRWRAMFRDSAGGMILMNELTDQSIRIDYLRVDRSAAGTLTMVPIPAGSLPASPAENRRVCLVDPNSLTCIRIVRVRVCNPGKLDKCEPMQFQPLIPLINLSLPLPTSTALVKAQSLGL